MRNLSRLSLLLILIINGLICFSQGNNPSITYNGSSDLCSGQSITLNVSDAPSGASYQWTKDGIDITGATTSSYTTFTAGTYNVKINNGNNNLLNDVKVTVNPKPFADFSFTPLSGCGKTKINFTNLSNDGDIPPSNNNLQYSWDFGDGSNPSNSTNPTHTFNPGKGTGNTSFNIKLIVTNNSGCKDTITKSVSIGKSPDPSLNGPGSTTINGEPYFKICSATGQTFNFTNGSSTTNTQYIIHWGDGTPDFNSSSFNSPISHSYSVGLKQLTFIVYSGTCVDSNIYNVFVGNIPAGGIANLGGSTICAGDILNFGINEISNNPPGTMYVLNYNDGTKLDTFFHPAPDTVIHIFPKSSCGINSSNGITLYNNSFGAYLTITNPCGIGGGSALPVYVSDKPKANFTVSKDSVCEGNTVSFLNTGNSGNNVENGVCTPGKFIWRVNSSTPGASWTLSSGILGNDFGLPDANLWNGGSSPLDIRFNTKGTYTITLVMANNTLCGADSIVKSICVNPAPTASFSVDAASGCPPLNVKATGITNVAQCGTYKFIWSVSYAATSGCTPNTSSFIFTGGTNANSVNPQFQFINPGVYTINLQTTAPGGNCSSAIVQQQITIKGKPVVTINTIPPVCLGTNINPTATSSCYTTPANYNWSFPGGTPVSSNSAIPVAINYVNVGNYNISLDVTNECGTTSVSSPVTIKPIPDITVPSNLNICSGSSSGLLSFSGSLPGTVFNWVNNNTTIGLAGSGTGNISNFTTINNGTTPVVATVTVTPVLNGCSGTPKTFTITVNPKPLLSANNASICFGQTVALNVSGADSYAWTPSTGLSATTGSSVNASPSVTTTYTITGSITTTGCTNTKTVIVTVNPIPVVAVNSGIICEGKTIALTASGANSYSWSPSTGLSATTGASVTASPSATTNYIVTGTTAAGCTNTATAIVTVNPKPFVTVNSGTICQGTSLQLNAIGANTYVWTPSTGLSATIGASVAASPSATTSYIVTGTNSITGCTNTAVAIVTVNPKPIVTVNSGSICIGSSITLTASGANDYSWTPSTGLSATTGSVVTADPATTTTYSVTGTNTSTGCINTANSVVTVKPVPVITASPFNPTSCSSTTGTIIIGGLTPSTTYIVNYLKNGVAQTVTQPSNSSGNISILNLSAGIYSDITVTLNGCVSNKEGPFTLSDPNPPATPIPVSNSPICAGNTLIFNITNPQPGGSYTWSGPNGYNLTTTNNSVSIPNAQVIASGTYNVIVKASNCSSASGSVSVVVNPKPVLSVNSGSICSGNSIDLTATGADSYTWSPSTGLSSTTEASVTANPVTTTVYTISGTLTSTGCFNTATSTVTVNKTPSVSDQLLNICSGEAFSLSPAGVLAGTTYSWGIPTVTGGITGGNAGAGSIITGVLINPTNSVQTATYIITPKTGNCPGLDFNLIVTINPKPVLADRTATICSGETFQITPTTADAGVILPVNTTFTWGIPVSNPVGAITGGSAQTVGQLSVSQNLVNTTNIPATLTYTVVPKSGDNGNCIGNPFKIIVTINPKPKIPDQLLTICSGASFTVSPVNNSPAILVPANTTYTWTTPVSNPVGAITGGVAQSIPQSLISQTLINTTLVSATLTYVITPVSGANGNCTGNQFTITVTVNPQPGVSDLATTICSGLKFNVVPSGVPLNTTYTWTAPLSNPSGAVSGGSAQNIPQTSIGQLLVNTTNVPASLVYSVTPSTGACGNNTFSVIVTVNPSPKIAAQSAEICNGNEFKIEPIHNPPGNILPQGTTYTWTNPVSNPTGVVTGGSASGIPQNFISQTLFNSSSTSATLTYIVTPVSGISGNCSGASFTITVKVNPDAKAGMIVQKDTACYPFKIDNSVIINNSPTTANGTYNWYVNNVFSGTGINFPGYTLTNPGDSVEVKLVTLSKYGCKPDSIMRKFYTKLKPDASFDILGTSGCGPLTISFINTSVFNSSFKYFWNFGNGQSSALYQPGPVIFQPSLNFTDTSYQVTLIAFNECDTIKASRLVSVQSKPKARFSPSKTTGCSPLTIAFNNTSLGEGNTYKWDFGDGSVLSTVNRDSVSHLYITGIKDTFYVKLIAINPCGADTSQFALVITPNAIKLDFAVSGLEQNGCTPHTVRFINNSSGATIFKWNFGDGNILSTVKNIDTVAHTFLTAGIYTIKLFASNGCSDTLSTELITVFGKPVPAFTANVYTSCVGDSVRFLNQTTNGATSYLWKFGDGNTSNLMNPDYKYSFPGNYTVTLIAFKANVPGSVCLDSVKTILKIVDTLPVVFSMSSSYGTCTPFKVTFKNNFKNYALLEWDFGDGTNANVDSVEHTFLNTGIYFIRLTIRTAGGCIYTGVKRVEIVSPGGEVKIQTGNICFGSSVRFEAIPVNADTILWNFGDGNSLKTIDRVIYYQYQNPGTYYPSAIIKSADGCLFSVPGVYEIKVDKITAGYKTAQQENCGSTIVQFTDTSSVFSGQASVEWQFGDGAVASGKIVIHNYTSSNTYQVRLIVHGNSGCSDTISLPLKIFVKSNPNAQIDTNPLICTSTDQDFKSFVQSVDSITFYKWQFLNGIISNKPDVILKFSGPGVINVSFIAGTVYGCYDTARLIFNVNQKPIVTATPDISICKGSSISLNAAGASSYTWYPINGLSCINCATTIATPLITTPYTVKGISAEGCFSYDTVFIKVIQPFNMNVLPGDSICIGESIQLLASGATYYKWSPSAGLNRDDIQNPLATPVATTSYRVVGYDEFNCFTDTAFIPVYIGQYPVVNIGPDLVLSTGTLFNFLPTYTNGPIEKWLWNPSTNLSCTTCPSPVATIKRDISYTVKLTNYYGCSGSDSINIKVFCENSQVYIPNAFSPDGDGINDIFLVRSSGILQVISFRVFNRWGELVFERTNFQPNDPSFGWDGRIRGVIPGPDVFVYTVEVICDNGIPFFYKGNVSLLK